MYADEVLMKSRQISFTYKLLIFIAIDAMFLANELWRGEVEADRLIWSLAYRSIRSLLLAGVWQYFEPKL